MSSFVAMNTFPLKNRLQNFPIRFKRGQGDVRIQIYSRPVTTPPLETVRAARQSAFVINYSPGKQLSVRTCLQTSKQPTVNHSLRWYYTIKTIVFMSSYVHL